MAAGRGQFFLSLMEGLQQVRAGGRGQPNKTPGKPARAARPPARPPAPPPPPSAPPCRPSKSRSSSTTRQSHSQENHIDKLPPEIILKIFSYLDAYSLFCVCFVNSQFHKLANDNSLWYELYAHQVSTNKRRSRLSVLPDDSTNVQDMPPGFWKRLMIREMGFPNHSIWKKELRHVNPHTGMPSNTVEVLGNLRVSWEITLTQKGGQENVYKQSRTFFSDSSITVCWNSATWPRIHHVSTLQLHGVTQPFAGSSSDKLPWRSLISKVEVSGTERWKFLMADKLVKLLLFEDGIILGIWRGTWIIAFIMVTLHFHRLVERSVLGSLSCPYVPPELSPLYDEEDPDAVLPVHTINIVLHNSVRRIMRRHYSPVICMRDDVHNGFAQFRLASEHTPVLGRISFPWTTEGLQGDIKDCCMMTLTVLDEGKRPFWCVNSTVTLLRSMYNNEQFRMMYDGVEGKVRLNFVWIQDMQQFFLTGVQIRVSEAKLKKQFGKRLSSSQAH